MRKLILEFYGEGLFFIVVFNINCFGLGFLFVVDFEISIWKYVGFGESGVVNWREWENGIDEKGKLVIEY